MITESKKVKMAASAFSLVCLVAMGICLICDLAINKMITWSAYPLISIPFGWAILSLPLLASGRKVLVSLAALTALLLPYLYFLARISPVDWFAAIGLPIGIASLVMLWITYFVIRFLKINMWYISALMTFLYGAAFSMVIRYFVGAFTGKGLFTLDNIINTVAITAVTALLIFIGYGKGGRGKE